MSNLSDVLAVKAGDTLEMGVPILPAGGMSARIEWIPVEALCRPTGTGLVYVCTQPGNTYTAIWVGLAQLRQPGRVTTLSGEEVACAT